MTDSGKAKAKESHNKETTMSGHQHRVCRGHSRQSLNDPLHHYPSNHALTETFVMFQAFEEQFILNPNLAVIPHAARRPIAVWITLALIAASPPTAASDHCSSSSPCGQTTTGAKTGGNTKTGAENHRAANNSSGGSSYP